MKPYSKTHQTRKPPKDEAPPKVTVQADDIARALLVHFRKPPAGYAVACAEVGLDSGRRVDLVFLRYSKGPVAFEIKVNRADWLAETRDPIKHLDALNFAGQLYIAAPAGVVQEHELPDGVGLYEVAALTGKAKCVVVASKRPPEPLNWWMGARLVAGALRAVERGIT